MADKKNQADQKKRSHLSLEDVLASKEQLPPELQEELESILSLESEIDSDAEERPSSFRIETSNDNMELWLRVDSKDAEIPLPQIDEILERVVEEDYQCEILVDNLAEALKTQSKEGFEFLIGRGRSPKNGKDGWIEFHVEEPTDHLISEKENEQIDYRTHIKFVDVRKDQELLTVHPPGKSEPGKDVLGNLIPAMEGKPIHVSAGRNIQYIRETGVMYSAIDGCFLRNDNGFRVEDVFVVDGDLDMSVGNIDTVSKVLVRGNVQQGFQIRSSSDIHVMGNVEASDLISEGGWVRIEGGILGKNKSRIKAPLGLVCKFAQQALISSEGIIAIEDSVLFCTISCGDRLIVSGGKHAAISGGNIRIHKSVEALTIGAPNEPFTSLTMGFDFAFEDELHLLDCRKLDIMNDIEELESQIKASSSELIKVAKGSSAAIETRRELVDLKKESLLMKVELDKLSKKISEVESKALKFDQAWIRAKKSIHGNTLIRMSRCSHKIDHEIQDAMVELAPKSDLITINGEKA